MLTNFDFSSSPLGTRLLAAAVTLLVCAALSAGVVVFGMMMLLFSTDGGGAKDGNWLPNSALIVGGFGVAMSTLVTPILVLFRVSAPNCYYPAAIGFFIVLGAIIFAVTRNVQ